MSEKKTGLAQIAAELDSLDALVPNNTMVFYQKQLELRIRLEIAKALSKIADHGVVSL